MNQQTDHWPSQALDFEVDVDADADKMGAKPMKPERIQR
jgi:hypothetical protein